MFLERVENFEADKTNTMTPAPAVGFRPSHFSYIRPPPRALPYATRPCLPSPLSYVSPS